MTDLTALRQRLEAATGPDREIDSAILQWELDSLSDAERMRRAEAAWAERGTPQQGKGPPLNYTASLDAAIALVERVLPKWWLESMSDEISAMLDNKPKFLGCAVDLASYRRDAQGIAATRPLAVLSALFAALTAGEVK